MFKHLSLFQRLNVMSLKDKLAWRFATKKFDASKKLNQTQLTELLDTVRLAPSSYGLQHYKIVVVEDAEVKAKLKAAAYGQAQLTDASHVIVFAAETSINDEYVKKYIDEIAKVRQVGRENLAGFEQLLSGVVNGLTQDQKTVWAQKQAYIALGVLLTAAAELGLDACPMEGFDAAQFDEILGLKEKGLTATVIAPIGFRSEHDAYGKAAKVRKPHEDLFITV